MELDVATDMLHAHPAQLSLRPGDYDELVALRQMRQGATLCKSCRKGRLVAQLTDKESRLTCEDCGKSFEDADIRRQLESM